MQTYIQSGNQVFSTNGKPATLEAALERAIEKHYRFQVPVIVRAAADWPRYIKANPFLDACEKEANHVMLCLSKTTPKADALKGLLERAAKGERIDHVGDALWIHFGEGVARSKLSPALLDRTAGSTVTSRNWFTVLKLNELAAQSGEKKLK